jgi:hypothetical protein
MPFRLLIIGARLSTALCILAIVVLLLLPAKPHSGLSIGFGTGPRIGFQSGPLWAVITPAELVRVARPG